MTWQTRSSLTSKVLSENQWHLHWLRVEKEFTHFQQVMQLYRRVRKKKKTRYRNCTKHDQYLHFDPNPNLSPQAMDKQIKKICQSACFQIKTLILLSGKFCLIPLPQYWFICANHFLSWNKCSFMEFQTLSLISSSKHSIAARFKLVNLYDHITPTLCTALLATCSSKDWIQNSFAYLEIT